MKLGELYEYLNALEHFRIDENIIYPDMFPDRKRWIDKWAEYSEATW